MKSWGPLYKSLRRRLQGKQGIKSRQMLGRREEDRRSALKSYAFWVQVSMAIYKQLEVMTFRETVKKPRVSSKEFLWFGRNHKRQKRKSYSLELELRKAGKVSKADP